MNSSPEDGIPPLPRPAELRDPALVVLGLLLIIGPSKFGSVVGAVGQPIYPIGVIEWIFGIWPPFLASVLAGGALAVTLLCRRRSLPPLTVSGWLPTLPYLVLLVGALPGFLGTTEWATAVPIAWLLLAGAAMVVAVHLQTYAKPESRKWLILAIVIGALWCVWSGIYQILWGFDEIRSMVEQMVRSGQDVPSKLMSRIQQDRVFGTFTYPNNLAAHLVLTMPLIAAFGWRLGSWFEPVKVSRVVLTTMLLGGAIWCFVETDSRGAFVALAVAATAMVVVVGRRLGSRQGKWAMILAAILAVSAGAALVAGGRARMSAIEARVIYYQTAVEMTAAQPLAGVGWGEFYPWYMRLKPPGAEETRMPHNLFLSFASQAGIAGALAALLLLLHPLVLLWRGGRYGWQPVGFWSLPLAFGLLAWLAHSLADFNLMIPGTFLTVAALTALMMRTTKTASETARPTPVALPAVLALLTIAAIWQQPGEKAFQELETALRLERHEQALRFANEASRLLPHSPHPDDLYARYAARDNDFDEAARRWERAIERAPHRSGFHLRLAEVYLAKGDHEAAQPYLDAARTWYPHSPHLQRVLERYPEPGVEDKP